MAASTITVKLSPTEYSQVKRFLQELMEAKIAKAKRNQPVEVHPTDPKTRHELNQDTMAIKRLLDSI